MIQLIFKADRLTVIDFTPYHLVCLYRMSNHVQHCIACHEDFTRALRSGSDLARCSFRRFRSVVEWLEVDDVLRVDPAWLRPVDLPGAGKRRRRDAPSPGVREVLRIQLALHGTAVPGGTSQSGYDWMSWWQLLRSRSSKSAKSRK